MRGSRYSPRSHLQPVACVPRTTRSGLAARRFPLLLSIVSLFAAGAFASYGSPAVSDPVGSPTTPPSSYQGGLTPTPNPLQDGNNEVITGNVRGFRHFRGPIPYDSPTSFGAPLGSTRLDSFLRSSAIPQELNGAGPRYETFYSPSGTVSTIRPGRSGVFSPMGPRVPGGLGPYRPEQPTDVTDFGDVRLPRTSNGQTGPTLNGRWDAEHTPGDWPLPRTPEQMSQSPADEPDPQVAERGISPQYDRPMSPEEYQRQLEQFRRELERVKANAAQLEQSLRTNEDPSRESPDQAPADSPGSRPIPEGATPAPTDVSAVPGPAQGQAAAIPRIELLPGENPILDAGNDALHPSPIQQQNRSDDGQLIPDASSRIDRIAEVFLPQRQGSAPQNRTVEPGELPALRRMRETAGAFAPTPESPAYVPTDPADGLAATLERTAALLERYRSAPPTAADAVPQIADDNADANTPNVANSPVRNEQPSTYEFLDSASKEKFERHMKAAQVCLAQGRFDRAAESFALASLYNPTDPRVYLGRSHALFAAGEYVSSSMFLAKAAELDAARTLAKLDLVNVTGGPDLFVRRILELEQRAETDGASDLQFLLAYIYHQMDRPQEARTAIDAAKKGLPYSPAVDRLHAAISR